MLRVIKFGAKWCKPCAQQDKIIQDIIPEYDGILIYTKVDIEEDVELTEKYQIRSVPTIIFEKNGKVEFRVVGLTSGEKIKQIINEYIK